MKIKLTTLFLCIIYLSFACGSPEPANTTGLVFDTIPLINDSLLIREVENGIVTKEYREINGKKEGLFKKFDKNGKLEWSGNYSLGVKTGLWEYADSSNVKHKSLEVFKEGNLEAFGDQYYYSSASENMKSKSLTWVVGDSIRRVWAYYESGELGSYNYSNFDTRLDTVIKMNKRGDTVLFSVWEDGQNISRLK